VKTVARAPLLAWLLVLVVAGGTLASPSAAPLIHAVQAQATTAYRGEEILATWHGDGTQVTLGRVEHDPPGWTWLDYTPVGSSRRLVVLRHGAQEIQYDPATRTGTRSIRLDSDDDAFATSHLPWLLANYHVTATPGELLGRRTDRILLSPLIEDRPARRLDVDQQTGVILRSERLGPNGRLTQVTAFVTFEVMPQGWRADARLPRDLRLVDQPRAQRVTPQEAVRRLGGLPVEVAAPPGFHRVASYLTQGRDSALQTVYSDGLSVLVLSAQRGTLARPPAGSRVVQREGGPLWVREVGGHTLVHWAYSGWLLTMVGDVSADGLLQSAERTGVARAPRLVDHLQAWLRSLGVPF